MRKNFQKLKKKFFQIYCVVVVMMYYRRLNATTDEYEGKDKRGVRYKINRNGNSRRDLLDSYDEGVHRSPPMKHGGPYKRKCAPLKNQKINKFQH